MIEMTRYDSSFREPPWVIGSPKETYDWLVATHPEEKEKENDNQKKKYLTNLHIKFDFDVDTKDINSNCIFCKATGLFKQVEEDFDLLSTTELILRGLAKARFRNTVKIVVDNKVLYNHPEKKSDLRKTIDDLGEFFYEISKGKNIEITAALKEIENCLATIKINKIHSKKEHSVDIFIKGKIREDIYHAFFNYLNEKIGLKE